MKAGTGALFSSRDLMREQRAELLCWIQYCQSIQEISSARCTITSEELIDAFRRAPDVGGGVSRTIVARVLEDLVCSCARIHGADRVPVKLLHTIHEFAVGMRCLADITLEVTEILYRDSAFQDPRSDCSSNNLQSDRDPRVAKVRDQLEKEFTRPINIASMAASVNLSPSRLQHLFKETFHISITAFVNNRRLQHAAFLLLNSHSRVSEICYAVGWNDPCRFDRVFHSRFGCSPSEFRRRRPTNS
jgi:AraC-like DNA-binding protein